MKLLIVDDQLATLTGLANGIDWKDAGFDVVDTAQNAMEARISFARGIPDLMLCDIEMPVESGLDLIGWVRAQGYQTKVILLTCHSDFEYAQEAIRLGVSDYIVQPAPYHRIREKAEKALNVIREESSRAKMLDLARAYSSNQEEINSGVWRGYLLNTVELSALKNLPDFPDPDKPAYLIMIQLVQQTDKIREWTEQSLVQVMRNTIHDTFARNKYRRIVAKTDTGCYSLAVQPAEDREMPRDELVQLLHYLESMFDMYMPCSIAYYIQGPMEFARMPEAMSYLIRMRNANVTGQKGMFVEQSPASRNTVYKEQFYRWNMILKNAGGSEMARDAIESLRKYAAEGKLDGTLLMDFYRDITRLILSMQSEANDPEIFRQSFNTPSYMNAMYSQKAMEELIRLIADLYDREAKPDEKTSIVKTVQEYIEEHLSDTIRMEDLSELMHLNEDYLTRLFKKETGMSIKAYIIHQKMSAARELLQTTSLSVSSVAIQMGYNNFSHFAASYKKEFGITPAEEKKK